MNKGLVFAGMLLLLFGTAFGAIERTIPEKQCITIEIDFSENLGEINSTKIRLMCNIMDFSKDIYNNGELLPNLEKRNSYVYRYSECCVECPFQEFHIRTSTSKGTYFSGPINANLPIFQRVIIGETVRFEEADERIAFSLNSEAIENLWLGFGLFFSVLIVLFLFEYFSSFGRGKKRKGMFEKYD